MWRGDLQTSPALAILLDAMDFGGWVGGDSLALPRKASPPAALARARARAPVMATTIAAE